MGSQGFLLIVVAFAFLWFVLIRPQKKRQTNAQRMLNSLAVGDEVVTAGGLYGEITHLDGDHVLLRIAPELEVKVARRAIGAVTPPAEKSEEPEEPAETAAPEAGG
ncbi:MAG: preprotein translocase subunit YajC [Gaiellaceae bacterium]